MLKLQKREKENETQASADPESAAKPSAPVLEDTEAAGSCEAAETADTRTAPSTFCFLLIMRKLSRACKPVSKSNIFDSQVSRQ